MLHLTCHECCDATLLPCSYGDLFPKSEFLSGLLFWYVFNVFEFLLLILKYSFPCCPLPSFLSLENVYVALTLCLLAPDADGVRGKWGLPSEPRERRRGGYKPLGFPASLAGSFKQLLSSMEHWDDFLCLTRSLLDFCSAISSSCPTASTLDLRSALWASRSLP